ncbi:TetR/AcrR family transcriptional regulator [Acanthopleuribacter pedis]|uniref:TetR/AcrR family transcriptional regulator n=1 Tax=Acanthopleuribacter pedis TaxID=442870 RepID=A0A8J7Q5A6_9BACT|nr:TetR/AcrR family transcriptional regulator [Acanthopleuribacter pedis]MBO1318387.1 TetR/AcrR family transcriptional regulator [Acanthopleuribacter pedis]
MPPAVIAKEEVLRVLSHEFRTWGYDGATLSRLSQATGLVKASLYHHFPKGKQDMAKAVLDHVGQALMEQVVAPMHKPVSVDWLVKELCVNLAAFYGNGKLSCLVDVFSMGSAKDLLGETVKGHVQALIREIAALLVRAEIPAEVATARAERAVVLIQGGLIIGRALDRPEVFLEQLNDLPDILLAPVD